MIIEPFGELEFNTGWKKPYSVTFNSVKYDIVMKIKAYDADDGIPLVQKQAYVSYINNEKQYLYQAENAIKEEFGDATRFVPSMLLVNRRGECALLCDDLEEPDEGIAIVFGDRIKIVSQSEYL